MSWPANHSPYAVQWGGDWRPVTWLGIGSQETDDPTHATAAVIWVGMDEWVALAVTPGDVVRNPGAVGTFLTIDD